MTHSFPTRRSSDLTIGQAPVGVRPRPVVAGDPYRKPQRAAQITQPTLDLGVRLILGRFDGAKAQVGGIGADLGEIGGPRRPRGSIVASRSEEHTSEPQSLMRISYAVFCLNTYKNTNHSTS